MDDGLGEATIPVGKYAGRPPGPGAGPSAGPVCAPPVPALRGERPPEKSSRTASPLRPAPYSAVTELRSCE